MSKTFLFHTGFEEIREPDLKRGRRNADFGQGFYTSQEEEFSMRWARVRKDKDNIINTYELDTDGLKIKTFKRSREWFDYIFSNRAGTAGTDAQNNQDRLRDIKYLSADYKQNTRTNMFGKQPIKEYNRPVLKKQVVTEWVLFQ